MQAVRSMSADHHTHDLQPVTYGDNQVLMCWKCGLGETDPRLAWPCSNSKTTAPVKPKVYSDGSVELFLGVVFALFAAGVRAHRRIDQEMTDTSVEERVTLEALQRQTELVSNFIGVKMKHKKTSSFYVITDFVFRESDLAMCFTYQTLHKEPVRFMRPVTELFDGRFEFL